MKTAFPGTSSISAYNSSLTEPAGEPTTQGTKRKRDPSSFEQLPLAKKQKTSASTTFAPRKSATFLTTGGTIGSKSTNSKGGYAPSSDFGPQKLLGELRQPKDLMVHAQQLFGDGIDSKDMTDDHWLTLLKTLRDDKSTNVVMTHGTDSMALTAFFLSLTLPRERLESQSVTLTGAMLPSDNPAADGPRNIENALSVAASDATGVFAVMNGSMLAPPWFDKRHTTDVNAMQPVNGQAVGQVIGDNIMITEPPKLPPRSFEIGDITKLPNVAVISAQPGTNPQHTIDHIRYLVDKQQVEGIVWQGTGGGTGNQNVMNELNRVAKDKQISVVRASLSGAGCVDKDKHHDDSDNAIATAGRLPSASHARVLLQVAIAHERRLLPVGEALDTSKVNAAFDDYR